MTTTRIVRGTKARIFLYICAVLIITGVIACYNNTLSQLEEARKSNEICHQQEENLSTQLQVISDYKQKLEKSLKTEKADHQQTKTDLAAKINERKLSYDKALNEANLRFNSLQQHSKILQAQYEDLQTKLKDLQDELIEVKESKESLKTKFLDLQNKNGQLEDSNAHLVQKIEKDKTEKDNNINRLTKENHDLLMELEQNKARWHEALQPPDANLQNLNANQTNQTVLNPVHFEPVHQVQMPVILNNLKTPSKSTTSSTSVSKGKLDNAKPLLIPTITPKTMKNVSPESLKLPEGVVPVPEKTEDKKTEEEKPVPNETINNRYRNKIVQRDYKMGDGDIDKDAAREVFDQHIYDNFGFNEVNDHVKSVDKNDNKNLIDRIGVGQNKLYENDENAPLEENDPDDDPDYADHKNKDVVVRN